MQQIIALETDAQNLAITSKKSSIKIQVSWYSSNFNYSELFISI